MKPNPDNCVETLHKNITIYSKRQKHFDTICHYALVAYRCQVYHFSWTFARPCVAFVTAYRIGHMVAIMF